MWFNQAEPIIERSRESVRITFPARSVIAALVYLFIASVVAGPLLALNDGWWWALPALAVAAWPAACSLFNVVTLELTPTQTRARYGPLPWFRFGVSLGKLARLRLDHEVEVTTTSQQHGRTTTSTRCVPMLKLSDVDGQSASICLGPPRAGVSSVNNLDDISERLSDELGLKEVAERAREARLKASGTRALSGGGVGLCPRDDEPLGPSDDAAGARACGRCGGRLIDADNSRQVLEQTLGLSVANLQELSRMFGGDVITCPGCSASAEAVKIKGQILNHCFSCRATWLDADEVAPFQALTSGDEG
jgi:hypothetical protein